MTAARLWITAVAMLAMVCITVVSVTAMISTRPSPPRPGPTVAWQTAWTVANHVTYLRRVAEIDRWEASQRECFASFGDRFPTGPVPACIKPAPPL